MRAVLLTILCSLTAGSHRLPVYLERHMNASVNACEDFYQHACGGWAQTHSGRGYRSQLEQLDHAYNGRLAKLLELEPVSDEPRFVQLLRDSYAACRKQQGRYNVEQLVRWLREWNKPQLDKKWSRLLRLLMSYALNTQLQLEASSEVDSEWQATETAELWLLQLQPPWPALAEEASVDVDWPVADFQPFSRGQFRRLYRQLQPLAAEHNALWQQVKLLERQLWLLSQVDRVERAPEMDYLYPPARWLLPLSLPANNSLPADVWYRYLRRLPQLLAAQPKPLLAKYLQLRLLHKLQMLPAPAFTSQECAAQSRQLLTHASVWLLQQQQPAQQRDVAAATMQKLFGQLCANFELQLLANRNRFQPATQRYLLQKLRRMQLHVGVLSEGLSPSEQLQQLKTHYAQLQLNGSDYYGNLAALLQQQQQWTLQEQKIGERKELYLLQPDGYGSYSSPFFLPTGNMLLLPLSLLAAPLYRPQHLPLYTHSALGFLLAHELSHGFAPSDVHYDARGRVASAAQRRLLRQSERFSAQLRCLRRRYGHKVDEQFADNNGLALAYYSYTNAAESAVAREEQQIFFLNFAQFFCQDEQQLPESTAHGSSRERVNGAVAGFEPFSEAFGCPRDNFQRSCHLY